MERGSSLASPFERRIRADEVVTSDELILALATFTSRSVSSCSIIFYSRHKRARSPHGGALAMTKNGEVCDSRPSQGRELSDLVNLR
jgi:hypothetical protein